MEKQFKYIKGAMQTGQPADIYFYTDVDYWSVDDFLWELKYLIDYIKPSQINVHINSVGGSCVDGISVFSRLIDCPIPTACYNDGLAASMASIIWAAGKEVYMKDYALLMIHNPFCDNGKGNKEYNQVTDAFTQQLKIIYQKRFGLAEDEIEKIMNGEEGNDGTFFTAAQAVEKGFITQEHIIETPEAERGQVSAALKGGFDVSKLKAVMNSLSQMPKNVATAVSKTDNSNINSHKPKDMTKEEINVFAVILGLSGEKATVENVSAQITELKAKAEKHDVVKAQLDEAKKKLADTQVELEGSKASVKNLTANLEKANATLKEYQDAEKAAKAKTVSDLVEAAIKDCKIDKEDKETWMKMAESDFDLAKKALDKIPARDNLGNIIASQGAPKAQEGMKSEEELMAEKVEAVVGKDFQFRKLV